MQGLFISLFWLSLLAFAVSLVMLIVAAVKKTGKVKRYVWVLAGSVVCFFVAVAGVEPAETVQSGTESNESVEQEAVATAAIQQETNAQTFQSFRERLLNLTAKADAKWDEFETHLAKVESGEEEPTILDGYKNKITAICDEIFNLPVDDLTTEEREAAEKLKDIMASAYFELAKAAGYYYDGYANGNQKALQQAEKRVQHFYEELENAEVYFDKLEN